MRKANIGMALFLLAVGGIVLFDAIRLGYGWGMSGPAAGFFPFWLAVGVLICSAIVLFKGIRVYKKEGPGERLIPEGGLKPILWVLLPSAGMVILTSFIGLHLAALCFLAFYMRAVGKIGWVKVALVSVLVPLGMYILFDKLFLIPLPQGLWGGKILFF
jgi:putative tricarboxylic transport membrane protein